MVLGGSVVRSGGGAGGGVESVLLAAESRRRESFATDDSRGRIVEPGFEKGGGGTQRVIETDAHTEDGASHLISNGADAAVIAEKELAHSIVAMIEATPARRGGKPLPPALGVAG